MSEQRRVVVITGSAGGIGSAMVSAFAALGDVVVGLDLADGVDLTDPAVCDAAVARILAAHGRIDVLCNNAGIASVGDVVSATPDDWQRVFAVNVFAMAYLSRAALPSMRAAGRGAIVNTCSVAALIGLVERAVYSASKGAVLSLTKAMAADEIPYGIRVNCMCPATVESPWVRRLLADAPDPEALAANLRGRQPMGRMASVDEVAASAVWLSSEHCFATGTALSLDGGITTVKLVEHR